MLGGANRAGARAATVGTLVDHIATQKKIYPEAHQFVIAHSHGGTIAVTALAQHRNLGIDGIACLSTPFIHVQERLDYEERFMYSLHGIATIACICLVWA